MGVPFVGESLAGVATPGFEGFEKRLEVQFFPTPQHAGLRALSRAQIDGMLKEAECTIVSQLSNEQFDSYVLSESSLFVYPFKIVIKTCGTTRLLRAVPLLLEYSSRLQIRVSRCKYTRGSFLFPAVQPFPHGSFSEEVKYLDTFFGHLGRGGKSAFVMGDGSSDHDWHIYYAAEDDDDDSVAPADAVYTLEMCMTHLNKESAAQFQKSVCASAAEMTRASGIEDLLPGSEICDYAFDPCGYSMNGVEGGAHSTIHVTPEDGFSYASFEAMGYGPKDIDLQLLVDKVASVFQPAVFSVALHGVGGGDDGSWGSSVCPRGYACESSSRQELCDGSAVVFHTFNRGRVRSPSLVPLPLSQPRVVSVMESLKLRKQPK